MFHGTPLDFGCYKTQQTILGQANIDDVESPPTVNHFAPGWCCPAMFVGLTPSKCTSKDHTLLLQHSYVHQLFANELRPHRPHPPISPWVLFPAGWAPPQRRPPFFPPRGRRNPRQLGHWKIRWQNVVRWKIPPLLEWDFYLVQRHRIFFTRVTKPPVNDPWDEKTHQVLGELGWNWSDKWHMWWSEFISILFWNFKDRILMISSSVVNMISLISWIIPKKSPLRWMVILGHLWQIWLAHVTNSEPLGSENQSSKSLHPDPMGPH